ncbi:MAG: ABC transporter ATP-binding protein [Candidatus Bathyarchaeota archaeon]|nr:MAG: ABC transporter ATP-binding protein [Candidatus Bathyarchaeota archaeon]
MQLLIENVSKRYKGSDSYALRDLTLDIGPGILGLLGPNGAGKSTLMRIIATITKSTHGTVSWNGVDIAQQPDELRAVLGYLPQDFGVYPNLDADEFLRYMAAIKGVDPRVARDRIDDLLEFVNLFEARKRPLGDYSGGMKQRIGIAQALLNDPRILIIDEPTVGLDTEGRVRFRHLLAELAGERVVVLSTHIVSDVEATANDIAIINRGHLLFRSSPEELLQSVEGKIWDWVIPSSELPTAKQRHVLSSVIRRKDGLHTRVVAETRPAKEAMPTSSPTLEEAYLFCISTHRGAGAQ